MSAKKHHHLGFVKLEHIIEKGERKAHPNYSNERIKYIADATAGRIARQRKGKR